MLNNIPEDCRDVITEEDVNFIAQDYISTFESTEDEEFFWSENKARLVRINHTVRDDAKKIYEEPPRATERTDGLQISQEMIIDVCSRKLEAFAKYYFPHYFRKPNSEFHKFLYSTLEKETSTNKTFKWAVAAPRGYGKSSVISVVYPLWCICYNIKKYIIVISDTAGQAEDFLRDVKLELENNEALKRDFSHVCGKGKTWKTNEIITNNGIKVLALGAGNQIRGRRWGAHRPDLIVCHEKGTQILYDGSWINVEDHPTAQLQKSDGYEIELFGVPYPEVVSENHRYYGMQKLWNKCTALNREMAFSEKGWIEAKDIDKNSYIGYKIDNSTIEPEMLLEYCSRIITERNKQGQIVDAEVNYQYKRQEEFYDKEFWWFVGLWLGDGHTAGKYQVGITIRNEQNFIFDRLKNLLNKYTIKFTIIPKKGCYQVIFSWAKVNRWFKSFSLYTPHKHGMKRVPVWVEKIDIKYQKELIQGYIDADGFIDYKDKSIRITGVCYENLLSIRRILMRLGVLCSIRKGIGPRKIEICGVPCNSSQKYDLRFKYGAELFGANFDLTDRYTKGIQFIEDGYFWSKIKAKKEVKNRIFVPIKTDSGEYLTHFGISHNCDDCENSEAVRSVTQRENLRYDWFNKDVLHVGGVSEDSITSFLWVGTILGKDALLNALINPKEYPDWNSKVFSAVKSFSISPLWQDWEKIYKDRFNDNRVQTALKFYEEHEEEMLEGVDILWPEGDTYYNLMVAKITDELAFQSEKMNNPFNTALQLIDKEDLHFRDFHDAEWYDIVLKTFNFGALDPSLGKHQKRGDRSAIVVVGRDFSTGLLFVKDIYAKRIPVDAQLQKIYEYHLNYSFKKFAVESNQAQFVIAENLKKFLRERGKYLAVENITQSVDKKLRFEGIVPLIKDGTILFDRWKYEHDQMYKYGVDQISTFTGNDTEDDVADALVMAVNLAKKPKFQMLFA